MTWALLAVSVVLNDTTHYLESTHTPQSWLLVVTVAAVPPTVLGLTVHLAVDMKDPDRRKGGSHLSPSEACPSQVGAISDVNVSADTDRPDQGPRRVLAGSVTSEWIEGDSNVNSGNVGLAELISQDMGRPDRECDLEAVGSTAPETPDDRGAGDASHVRLSDIDRPDQERALQPAGPTTRGVEASDLHDTSTPQPLSELIESGAGRRRIAAELDISEHSARRLLEQHRNGHANVQA